MDPINRSRAQAAREGAAPQGARAPSAGADTRTVLCIEDSPLNLKLIERVLDRLPGVQLVSSTDGSGGVELAFRLNPDLILLDMHLPDISGEQVLADLRAEPATQQVPVVVLSADATPERIAAILQQGADEYLTKPLDIRSLLAIVRARLGLPAAGS